MKLLTLSILCTVSLLTFSGCNAKPKPKENAIIDKTLPVVELTKNGIVIDTNAIAFEWHSISDNRVDGFFVYKSVKDSDLTYKEYYETLDNRFITHFVDTDVKPDTQYAYIFQTYSKDAESQRSKIKLVNSLPVLQSVTWIHSIQGMPKSAKIIWRPHINEKVKEYVIERRVSTESKWETIATVKHRLSAEYIDKDLKDDTIYKYRIRVVTFDGITSTPSEIVQVVTKALPPSVKEISATKDLPKEVKISWDVSLDEDFSHYQLYRADSIDGSYELIAKVKSNSFVDKIKEDGKTVFYRVSVVDTDGLESIYSAVTAKGSTKVKLDAPVNLKAKLVGDGIHLSWDSADDRSETFYILRTYQKSFFKKVEDKFENITTNSYVDKSVKPNMRYMYQVFAVDKDGIVSLSSKKIEINSQVKQEQEIEDSTVEVQEITSPIETK